MKQATLILVTIVLCSWSVSKRVDVLYQNYVAALTNQSTFQYFLVIKVKDLNTGVVREICTKGNFLRGALHKEYHLPYDGNGLQEVERIARDKKDRYFEFKNDSAIWNLGVHHYAIEDLEKLEHEVDFDALATQISNASKWETGMIPDKTMLLYAHALFNRGILTGENNCFGGRLEYVPDPSTRTN